MFLMIFRTDGCHDARCPDESDPSPHGPPPPAEAWGVRLSTGGYRTQTRATTSLMSGTPLAALLAPTAGAPSTCLHLSFLATHKF